MTNRNTLPDPLEVADTLAAQDYDLEAALEAYGLPFDLSDRAIADLVDEVLAIAEAAHRRLAAATAEASR